VKITFDRALSLAALLVAIGGLAVVVEQGRTASDAQSAAVLPYVTIAIMVDDEGAFLVVHNAGVGAALVEDVRIRHRGREFPLDPYDFYLAERGADSAAGARVDELDPGGLIRPGDGWLALGFEGEDAEQRLGEMLELFAIEGVPPNWYEATQVRPNDAGRASIEVTYASILGERWRAVSSEAAPVPLD
jgi:hypothetical protein